MGKLTKEGGSVGVGEATIARVDEYEGGCTHSSIRVSANAGDSSINGVDEGKRNMQHV